jgi:hypothetical protein
MSDFTERRIVSVVLPRPYVSLSHISPRPSVYRSRHGGSQKNTATPGSHNTMTACSCMTWMVCDIPIFT